MALKQLVLTLTLGLGLALAAGCGSGSPDIPDSTGSTATTATTVAENTAPASLTLTRKDDGGTFEVRTGGTITLTLAANPGAGYAWEMDDADPEASLIEQTGEPAFVPDNPDAVGAAGTITYTFRAADRGNMVIRFVYLGPDAAEEPTDAFQISLTVR